MCSTGQRTNFMLFIFYFFQHPLIPSMPSSTFTLPPLTTISILLSMSMCSLSLSFCSIPLSLQHPPHHQSCLPTLYQPTTFKTSFSCVRERSSGDLLCRIVPILTMLYCILKICQEDISSVECSYHKNK